MKVALVYVHVCELNDGYDPSVEAVSGTYDACARRFVSTYLEFPAGSDHELIVVLAKGEKIESDIYNNVNVRFVSYFGDGWCSGAHQHAAKNMDADFAVFLSTRTHFWKAGWLKRFIESVEWNGEDGMYASMSSREGGVPHLRTNFYGFHPDTLRSFEHPLDSREASRELESGKWNISKRFYDEDKPSMLVTWEKDYTLPLWRYPQNIFRRGDQSACIVWDRHSEIYSKASAEEKMELEKLTDP